MKASDYITLTIIDKIFTEKANCELKPLSKMIYINILTHHFKNIDANEKNLSAFQLFPDEIKYNQFQKNYQELHKAQLITIGEKYISFNNTWGSYIDRSSLAETSKAEYSNALNTINTYKENIQKNQSLVELIAMKHRWNSTYFNKVMDMFFMEQEAVGTKYLHESECTRHFINWCNNNSNKLNTQSNGNQTKILGI